MVRKNKLLSILLITTSLVIVSPTIFVVSCKKEKKEADNLKDKIIYFNKFYSINENIKLIENQLNKNIENIKEKIKYKEDFYIKFIFNENNEGRFIEELNIFANPISKKIFGSIEAKQRLDLNKDILNNFNYITFKKQDLKPNDQPIDYLKNLILEKINNQANDFFGNDIKLVEDKDLKINIEYNDENGFVSSIYALNDSKYIYGNNQSKKINCYEVYNLDFFKNKIKFFLYELEKTSINTNLISNKLNETLQSKYFTNEDISFKLEKDLKLIITAKNLKKIEGNIEIKIIDKEIVKISNEFREENYFLFTSNDLLDQKKKNDIFKKIEDEVIKNYKKTITYIESKKDIKRGKDGDFVIEESVLSNNKLTKQEEKNISIRVLENSKLLHKNSNDILINPYKKIKVDDLESKLSFFASDKPNDIKNEIEEKVKKIWNINVNNYWSNREILSDNDYSIHIIYNDSNKNEIDKVKIEFKKESKYFNSDSTPEITFFAEKKFNLKRLNYVKVSDNYFSNSVDKYERNKLEEAIIKKIKPDDLKSMGQRYIDWDFEINEDFKKLKDNKETNKIASIKIFSKKNGSDSKVVGEYEVQKIQTRSINDLRGMIWQESSNDELSKYIKSLFTINGFEDLKLIENIDYKIIPIIKGSNRVTDYIKIEAKLESEKISGTFIIDVTQKFDLKNLQPLIDNDEKMKIKEGLEGWKYLVIEKFEYIFKKAKEKNIIPEALKWDYIKNDLHYRIIGNSNDLEKGITIESIDYQSGLGNNKYIQGSLNFKILEKKNISNYYDDFVTIRQHNDFGEFSTTKDVKNLFKEEFDKKFPNYKIDENEILVSKNDMLGSFNISISNDNKDFKGSIDLQYFKRIHLNTLPNFSVDYSENDDWYLAKGFINQRLTKYIREKAPPSSHVQLFENKDYNLTFKRNDLIVIIKAKDNSKWIKEETIINITKK